MFIQQELFASIPETLTFNATEEDMLDFSQYVERLEKICESGACKVIAPITQCKTSETDLYQKMMKDEEILDIADQ